MKCLPLLIALLGISVECSVVHKLHVGVLFTTQIDHNMFNWTSNVATDKFSYRASLKGYPDLPPFLRYMYSEERRVGYLYGSPTEEFVNRVLELDVVALNKQTYSTRTERMVLKIERNQKHLRNILQMKIDNLDWVNLMDPGRIEDLKNVFRAELWPESEQDLSVVFLDAAVNMGSRLPASPQLKEGVIVQLGSSLDFSTRLRDLQEEIRPLYKLASCNFKRTSVQAIFEHQGFKLDWCAFKLIEVGDGGNSSRLKSESPNGGQHGTEHWLGLKSEDIPQRNYIDELAITIAIPGMILAILVAVLSGILCFQHESV